MAISKIIHQTDKSDNVRRLYRHFRDGLLSMHPEWEYKFYDDEACRRAVEKYLPTFLPIYDSMTVIQKTDIFRIIIVYAEGGFYLDIDVECLSPLDDLCEFHCVFAEELIITEERAAELGHRDSLRVGNFMFGSEPGHPFLLHILRKMAEESRREITSEHDVLESTGPGLVTTVYYDSREELRDVVLIPNRDRICSRCGGVSCHFGNFARHAHIASWRLGNAADAPLEGTGGNDRATQSQINKICGEIDSKIGRMPVPEPVYQLRTHNDAPDDGLSYVYNLTSGIGVITDDTKHLSGRKVLVSGMPHLYTDRISPRNLNVVYTTFESDRLPSFWVDAINEHYQYCIVPHGHVKRMFKHSGVNIPVEVIHQGFTRYNRLYREAPWDVFRIGFLGVPYNRKNLFKLFQACVNLSAEIPGLRLAVHAARLFGDMLTPEMSLIKLSPFVEWTEGAMSEDEVAQWYGGLSCYVFPSSGEGWSFTPRESLYLGIPTVLTDIPVHRDLIDSGYCKEIPVSGKQDAVYEGRIFGKWDRVCVEDIEDSIRDLYLNYGSYYIKALQGSRWIENKWTNESSQQMLLDFIVNL